MPDPEAGPLLASLTALGRGFSQRGDHAFIEAAEGVACAALGDGAGARQRLLVATELVRAHAPHYASQEMLLMALLRAERVTSVPDSDEVKQAILSLRGRPGDRSQQEWVQSLERCARHLWAHGDEHAMATLLASDALPTDVRNLLRRSLLVDAPRYAPHPVDAVLGFWDDAPVNADLGHEQVHVLIAALDEEGRPQDAEAIRRAVTSPPRGPGYPLQILTDVLIDLTDDRLDRAFSRMSGAYQAHHDVADLGEALGDQGLWAHFNRLSAVSQTSLSESEYKVVATVHSFGDTRELVAHFVKEGGQWRISTLEHEFPSWVI